MDDTLKNLLDNPATTLKEVAAFLDSLQPLERFEAVKPLRRKQQRRLYELAKEAPALAISDMVSAETKDTTWVRHLGVNTLPVPSFLRFFEKRCYRPEGSAEKLGGYNEGASRPLIGPGYFVTYSTKANAVWATRGDLVVDYFQVPEGDVPPEGPKVVPNTRGLQMFVYNGTRDFLRKVSNGVSIGAAYKGEKPLDHYFVLCRLDG